MGTPTVHVELGHLVGNIGLQKKKLKSICISWTSILTFLSVTLNTLVVNSLASATLILTTTISPYVKDPVSGQYGAQTSYKMTQNDIMQGGIKPHHKWYTPTWPLSSSSQSITTQAHCLSTIIFQKSLTVFFIGDCATMNALSCLYPWE